MRVKPETATSLVMDSPTSRKKGWNTRPRVKQLIDTSDREELTPLDQGRRLEEAMSKARKVASGPLVKRLVPGKFN